MWFNSSNISSIFWSWVPVPKRRYRSSGKEKESRCLEFTSATKREISHFHVLVVQWRQRNVQKCVMHVEGSCFANLAYCFLPFSLTSLSSLLKVPKATRRRWRKRRFKIECTFFQSLSRLFELAYSRSVVDFTFDELSQVSQKGKQISLWCLHDLHKTWN